MPENVTFKEIVWEREHRLEKWRLFIDLLKWTITGVCIVGAFFIIRPREQNRLDLNMQLEGHKAYLAAMDTQNVDLWERKLRYLKYIANETDGSDSLASFVASEEKRLLNIRSAKRNESEAIDASAKSAAAIAVLESDIVLVERKLREKPNLSKEKRIEFEKMLEGFADRKSELSKQYDQSQEILKEQRKLLEENGYGSEPIVPVVDIYRPFPVAQGLNDGFSGQSSDMLGHSGKERLKIPSIGEEISKPPVFDNPYMNYGYWNNISPEEQKKNEEVRNLLRQRKNEMTSEEFKNLLKLHPGYGVLGKGL